MSSSKSSGAFDRLVGHVGTELDQWVAGLRGDAALVVLVAGHVDVSVQAPCWSPAESTTNTEYHCTGWARNRKILRRMIVRTDIYYNPTTFQLNRMKIVGCESI